MGASLCSISYLLYYPSKWDSKSGSLFLSKNGQSLSLAKLLALVREASCCTGMDTCQYWGGRGGVSTLGLQQQSCKFVPLIPRCWAGWRALHTKGTCKLPERSLHQCNIHWPTLHTAPVLMLGIHLVSLAFGGYALLLKSHHNWCQ